jgi:hypothetical protein
VTDAERSEPLLGSGTSAPLASQIVGSGDTVFRYRVIPFIGQSTGSLSASDVANQLEATISLHVSQGWEFYQLSDVNIEVQPGCLAGLFGAKVQYVRFDQLIFRLRK